ncbi:MAG: sigma-70 family RNA polymerase sigma factor [Planctomycetes bacterium]|nr:sigma-70 family RNA polymerase sigma factor [Planctomycetota bacterium]
MRTTVTSDDLLAGLKDPGNATVWNDYVGRYRPVLLEFGRRLGLRDADAEDAAQQALLTFAQSFCAGRYDKDRGRLRHWLYGIAANAMKEQRRKLARERRPGAGDASFDADVLPAADALEALWDEEWRAAFLAHCLALVRDEVEAKTYAAFDRFACQDRPAAEVAAELGMTENAVYGCKRRVLERLRELASTLEESW